MFCPYINNKQVVDGFNEMVQAFGGRPMTKEEFKSSSLRNQRTGLDLLAMKLAYDVQSEFDSYSPHMTLAELKPGTAEKYLKSEKLNLLLENSVFDFDDLVLSLGKANEPEDRKQYFLTSYNSVKRYFRMENLKKELYM